MKEGGLRFVLVLFAVLTALFPRLVFSGQVLFERDLHQMLYGQYAALGRALAAGSWPVWDSWSGFGQPMLGNPAAQVLYPPTWLGVLLEPGRAYTVYVFGHLALGALAVRTMARRLGLSETGSAAASLAWMLSGPILSMVNLWHHLAGAALMPLVWVAADDVLRQPSVRRGVLLGGIVGLQGLAGSLDMCALTAILTGAWFAYQGIHAWGRAPIRPLVRPLVVAAAVAIALAAGLLVPALEAWRGSARVALSESMRSSWSLSPLLLPQVAVPLFPQRLPLPPAIRAQLFDGPEPFLASVYLGLVAAPIVAAGLWPRPRRPAGFLALAFAGASLVALGRHGLLYPALATFVPGIQTFRYPVKATVVMALAWAILVGLGLDALAAGEPPLRIRRLFVGAGTTLVLTAVAVVGMLPFLSSSGPLSPAGQPTPPWLPGLESATHPLLAAAGLGIVGLGLGARGATSAARRVGLGCVAALDLGLAHAPLNHTVPAAWFSAPPQVLSHLPDTGFVRVHSWDYMSRLLGKSYRRAEHVLPVPGAPAQFGPSQAAALGRHDFLSPPMGTRFGVHGSYARDWLGLQPRGVRNLGLIFMAREETDDMLRLLRLGGVSHTVSLHREGLEALSLLAVETSAFAGPVYLHRVPGPLPRAFAVSGARIADGAAALRMLLAPDFAPAAKRSSPKERRKPPSMGSFEVQIRDSRPDRIGLDAVLSTPGLVVVLVAWDPGWRASVDGRGQAVHRANVGFLAVRVPAGTHRLELVYRPSGLEAALVATAAAALLVVATLAVRSGRPASPA